MREKLQRPWSKRMNYVGSLAQGAVNVAWSAASLPARIVFGERGEGDATLPVSGDPMRRAVPCLLRAAHHSLPLTLQIV